ncbi:MAG: S-methyl-5-thioribose-1-phosphate isomerase [Planctomycetaceae bacterium]|jgi:methylthioribose-1-phosphate isomerase|nr:S-methyl-5-thioribose-1-phosphate isomerase [Planctomycetaceae bacterium]
MSVETLSWVGDVSDGFLRLIDQTLLPLELCTLDCRDVETVWDAIKRLRVRGAPAIGIAAAYGVVVGLQRADTDSFDAQFEKVVQYLASSRPTAVNLFWAIDRMKDRFKIAKKNAANAANSSNSSNPAQPKTDSLECSRHGELKIKLSPAQKADVLAELFAEAKTIHDEDRGICRAIGHHGQSIIKDGDTFITHCNAGGLATADYGTALAVFFAAAESGKKIAVYADETRPLLQGARLTAWELMQRKIDVTLICDSMAALVMRQGKINGAIVGADRIAANGDTANKIGTYGLAISAKAHGIPFYVAAPVSTFDLTINDGSGIPIEERDADEICNGFGKRTAPEGVAVYNPAFDVTPASLITGIITEKGIINPINKENISKIITK